MQNKTISIIRPFIFVFILTAWLLVPQFTQAQGFVQCSGPDCDFCDLVTMGETILRWLIQLAVIISTIILAVAGIRMVMARGNSGALNQAKDSLLNIVIGIFIVAIAFTFIDTLMKVLVGGSFGPWNEIDSSQCGGQRVVGDAKYGVALTEHGVPPLEDPTTPKGSNGGYLITTTYMPGAPNGGYVTGRGGTVEATACDTSQMTTVRVFNGKSVTVHQQFAPSLRRISDRWQQMGGDSFYRVRTIYGYSCRNISGSGSRSKHSYGFAIDINADQNPHRKSGCVTDMPAQFRQLFLSEGWGWGCNWRSSKDAMHFSKASNEGGNMQGG